MKEAEVGSIVSSFLGIVSVIILFCFSPYFARENIFFGVYVPQFFKKSKEAVSFIRRYQKNYLISILIPFVIFIFLLIKASFLVIIKFSVLYSLYIALAAMFNFYIINKEVLKLKRKSNWAEGKKQVVVVELKKRDDIKGYPSRLWLLLPLLFIIGELIILFIRYPHLPDKIPVHYNAKFEIDAWSQKEHIFEMVLPIFAIQIGLFVMLPIFYELIKRSKMQISIFNPPESANKNNIIKKESAVMLIILFTIVQIPFFAVILSMLLIISPKINLFASIALSPVAFIIVTIFMIRFAKINDTEKTNPNEAEQKEIDRQDDSYWIGGMFYYNPDDPALFIEKRFGLGFGINYARAAGKVIAFLAIAIVICSVVIVLSL